MCRRSLAGVNAMKILGWQLPFTTKAQAPRIPYPNQPTVAEILPPFGTNPPSIPQSSGGLMLERQIHSDPRELWYLALPSKLKPNVVQMILNSAAGGDIWQQWQLFTRMLDSWPMLRKCCGEVQSAVSQTKYTVRPFALTGKQPSREAVRRADFCSSVIQRMKPDPVTDEKGFDGMVYHLTNAFINGVAMCEILWEDARSEMRPRSSAFVHPRHYTFDTSGRIVVVDRNYRDYFIPDPNKFVIAQYSAHSGSSLIGGILRPLAWWWSAISYNREWMLDYAQRFGQPFRWSTYKPGTPDDEIVKINNNLQSMGSSAWASFVEGTTINFEKEHSLGPQQPQMSIMETADRACQLLILGQTLTSDVADSGSRALGDVHEGVRRERVEHLAQWAGVTLTHQMMSAICRVNFGDEDECPVIAPEFTKEEDPLKTAQRFKIYSDSGMPVNAEQAYREQNLEMPEEGDKVLVGGRLGVLGSTDDEITSGPAQTPTASPTDGIVKDGEEDPTQNGNGKPASNGKKNGKPAENDDGEFVETREAIVFAQGSGKAHVLPDFKVQLRKLRKARQKDFGPLLDRITKLEDIEDGAELKAALAKLNGDLPDLGDEAMQNGEAVKVVAGMLAKSLARGARRKRSKK